MSSLVSILPWALFGIMVLFGTLFAFVAWRTTRRANDAEQRAGHASNALAQMEARAQSAESRIAQAEQRAQMAEQRIAHAEDRMQKARDVAKIAEQKAVDANRRADEAASSARHADSQLQNRRDEAQDTARKAEQRARSLVEWAKQQWEVRREPDRQKAQAVQGAFQQQLEAYLGHRRQPITFRVDGEVDRLAAPLISRYAPADQTVALEGDLVRISFAVDASLGFRA